MYVPAFVPIGESNKYESSIFRYYLNRSEHVRHNSKRIKIEIQRKIIKSDYMCLNVD